LRILHCSPYRSLRILPIIIIIITILLTHTHVNPNVSPIFTSVFFEYQSTKKTHTYEAFLSIHGQIVFAVLLFTIRSALHKLDKRVVQSGRPPSTHHQTQQPHPG
jgi:hypothetical protein